jgi:hypothetical protein
MSAVWVVWLSQASNFLGNRALWQQHGWSAKSEWTMNERAE